MPGLVSAAHLCRRGTNIKKKILKTISLFFGNLLPFDITGEKLTLAAFSGDGGH